MDTAFVHYPAQTYRHGVRCCGGNKIAKYKICINLMSSVHSPFIQKFGTLYATFELKVVGQPILRIVSTKILPTLFDHKGAGFFLMVTCKFCGTSLNSSKQGKNVDTSNRFLGEAVAEWRHF